MSDLLAGGERRSLTVLVLDLVESTKLSTQLDPEDYDDLLELLHDAWSEVIDRLDGRIMRWMGDGFIAVFGYPAAHDNDSLRAAAAGLELVQTTRARRSSNELIPKVRVGIHTGLTLVRQSPGTEEFDIVGETPAIATRLEGLSPPDGVVASGVTASRIRREFVLTPLGPQSLKGVPSPVEAWHVVVRRNEPDVLGTGRLAGRDSELAKLVGFWRESVAGRRRAAVLIGQPGIGKTRLIEELRGEVQSRGELLMFRCSELMGTTPFFPVVRSLHSLLGWSPEGDEDALADRVEAEFAGLPNPLAGTLVGVLMGLTPRHASVLPAEPARQRAQLLETLVAWLLHRAEQQPLCLVLEDLHWADPSTIELLTTLVSNRTSVPLLVLTSTRPDPAHPWTGNPDVSTIELQPLTAEAATVMIEDITGGTVPDVLLSELLERSDAVPLYLEELTRAVTAAGRLAPDGNVGLSGLRPSDIPLSLSDSLMKRLDALGGTRALASAAAAIGRPFDGDLLAAVTGADRDLGPDLRQMTAAGVLRRIPLPGNEDSYVFAHALLRDAAYETLTRRTRRDVHARIAKALLEGPAACEPVVLAHHYTAAGLLPEAIGTWADAGQTAFAAGAYDEAIANFGRGLDLVPHLEPDLVGDLELPLQLGVALAYATRFGYVSVDAEAAYRRALELVNHLYESEDFGPGSFPALIGLWAYYEVRSDPHRRRDLAERCHEIARVSDDPSTRLEGLSALSTTLAFEGDLEDSLALMDEGLEYFEPHRGAELHFFMPQHPAAGFCAISGPLLWSRGEFHRAVERYERLRQFAEAPEGPYGLFTAGYAHDFCAWSCELRGDYAGAAAHAEAAIAIGTEHGFLVWIAAAYPHLGIATALLGDSENGIRTTTEGIAAWRASGSGLFTSYYEFGLALAHEGAGHPQEALQAVERGTAHCAAHGERFQLGELHRLRGRLFEATGRVAPANEERRVAARIARQRGARYFELLALLDLGRGGYADAADLTRLGELGRLLAPEAAGIEVVASPVEEALALAGRSASGASTG